MNSHLHNKEEFSPGDDFAQLDFEGQLAHCIRVLGAGGGSALDSLLANHPTCAAALRERLGALERLGMLPQDEGETNTIGPYSIERTLGQGATGRVFLAHHADTGEPVALKILTAPILSDSRAHQRFEREVLAFSSLAHPCIVKVHASGESDGRPWFAMEYVPGASLEEVLKRLRASETPFDQLHGAHIVGITGRDGVDTELTEGARGFVESICRIVLDIATALEHAHRFGIVHRDVKPGNIAITPKGRAKLLDLGLASLEGAPSLTRTGDFAGTPYYVAPEQANSARNADPRSDVFSLGVTLYEALTLRRPFEGKDAAQVFRNLQTKDPLPPGRVNALIPRDLETICLCALEKNPNRRYGSMGEMAADLQRFLEFKPVLATPVGVGRKALRLARRHPSLTLLLSILFLFLVGIPIAQARIGLVILRERDMARANAQAAARQVAISNAVVDHLVELFSPTDGLTDNSAEWGFEEMLQASIDRIPNELQQDALVRAALLEAAGRIHSNLNRLGKALPLLDKAYALRQREQQQGQPDLARTLVWLARAHLNENNPRAAHALASSAIEAMRSAGTAPTDPAYFDLRLSRAEATRRTGDMGAAREQLLALRALCTANPKDLTPQTVDVHVALAELQFETGKLETASAHCEDALDALQKAWVPDARRMTAALHLRARIERAGGKQAKAQASEAAATSLSEAFRRGRRGLSGGDWRADYPFELLPPWTAEFEQAFQEGITGLQTRHPAEAIAAFERCLVWTPQNPVCLYNLACAYAQANDVERGIHFLERAGAASFGILQGNLNTIDSDPDLALLRSDARFAALRAQLATARAQSYVRASNPRTWLPDQGHASARLPMLVVLAGDALPAEHREEGPDRFEFWKAVAVSLACPMVYLEGPLRGQTSAWIAEIDNFLEDPWEVQSRPAAAIAKFAKANSIAGGSVLLVGEGSGAPVAFDMAMRAPGFFGGALLLDGVPAPTPGGDALALARACDSRFVLLFGQDAQRPEGRIALPAMDIAAALEQWMRRGGLEARAESRTKRATELSVDEICAEVLELTKAKQAPLAPQHSEQ